MVEQSHIVSLRQLICSQSLQHTSKQTLPIMYNHLGVKQAKCNIWDNVMESEIHTVIVLKCSCTWTEYGKLDSIREDL